VNPASLVRAAWRTYGAGERQGGSTISMQLARLLHQTNTRTPAGKLRQIGSALWLEARYSKRELLEAYLNVVPFGGNIQGVGAASRVYFSKGADRVTLGEARIYPTVTFEAQPSDYVPILRSDPALKRFEFAEIKIDFEFLVNSNSFLRVRRRALV